MKLAIDMHCVGSGMWFKYESSIEMCFWNQIFAAFNIPKILKHRFQWQHFVTCTGIKIVCAVIMMHSVNHDVNSLTWLLLLLHWL